METIPSPLIEVSHLSYRYGNAVVWEDVSFSLTAGEICYLVGANGSGKSTLLRCLAGQSKAYDGTIKIEGRPFPGTDRSLFSRIFFVADVPTFYDDLTAEEHLEFILKAQRRTDRLPQGLELLERFGIARFKAQLPSSYSRGMRTKLALAIAFSLQTDILLLDEPFGPLDYDSRKLVGELIGKATFKGTTVLLSCHHEIPDLIPQKILKIEDGKLQAITHKELLHSWASTLDESL